MGFRRELLWQCMLGLSLVLGWSARAEAPLEPESLAQGTLAERQQAAARRVLSTSAMYSLLASPSGDVWVWGTGSGANLGTWPELQFGTGLPVRMPRMSGVRSVSTSPGTGHALALFADGTVEAWGDNFFGQLGDGTATSHNERVKVLGLTQAAGISAGQYHSLAVRADGSVWAWGLNNRGQLGDGTTTTRLVPTPVPGLSQVVAAAAGSNYSLALKQDGTVWAWGGNGSGQLGDGTQTQRRTPIQVPGLTDVVAIEARVSTSYAVRADGTVWAWGYNSDGQLGQSTQGSFRVTPAPVPGLTRVIAVSSGSYHSLALRQDGTVWAWGNNFFGQLGTGTQGGTGLPQPVHGLGGVVAIAADSYHSLALRRDGSVEAWGHNYNGAMGTGTHAQAAPGKVELKGVRSVSSGPHTLALREDGSVWKWGQGYNPWEDEVLASPERVGGLPKAVAVGSGLRHSLVVAEDGTVWAWGANECGQLGTGTVGSDWVTPAPVQGLSNVVAVATGYSHSLALKRDGTVWAWGCNDLGQLGDVTLEGRPLPVQVQGLEGVSSINASWDLSVAVKSDGTVWYWGSDMLAVWDYGDVPPHPAAPVPGLSNVVKVSMTSLGLLALRADGTVRQWYIVPDPALKKYPDAIVESITGAVDLVASTNTVQILRADGTVWNFGGNTSGERGFPTSEPPSFELAQVPGLTGVVALFSQSASVYALRADGSLRAWGANSRGELGTGVSPLHLRPARVLLPCKLKDLSTGEGVREQQCHAEH